MNHFPSRQGLLVKGLHVVDESVKFWQALCVYVHLCPLSVPDAPDVWVRMNRDNTGQVVWKVNFFRYYF